MSVNQQEETGSTQSQSPPRPKVRGQRPYSHSDLGFTKWKCTTHDAGRCIGLDFGGTLSKIVFFEPKDMPTYADNILKFLLSSEKYGTSGVRDKDLSFYSEKMGGRVHFINFETSHTFGAIKLLKNLGDHNIRRVHATGGGAFKFSQLFKDKLGIRLMKRDELQTVVQGLVFTLLEFPDSECYSYEPVLDGEADGERHHGVSHDALSYEMRKVPRPMPVSQGDFFPILVVNIGSGVSVINVTGPNTFKRVSGTAIGGATYYGLIKLLCRCQNFDQAMDLAELGDSREVNLTVQDIYGGSYEQAGLSGEITASFFGKAAAAPGNVRTKRSRKRPYVAFVERIGMVIIALLCANLLMNVNFITEFQGSVNDALLITREVILLALPLGVAYLVFWSGEAKLSSSHPPPDPVPNPKKKKKGRTGSMTSFEEADIARALVVMVAQNVTQIAFLNAQLHKSKRVLFTGNFLRHNKIALRALSSMMSTWSQNKIEALFMEHEGYFGAIGTFLHSCGRDPKGDAAHHRKRSSFTMDEKVREQLIKEQQQAEQAKEGTQEEIDSSTTSESSDEEKNVIEDLLYKGEFPRRRSMLKPILS